jgi:RNA polymerase sigma factor (sigma-70 family)
MSIAPVDATHTEFEALVEEHRARVTSLARRIVGDPELAEDITQETFLRAYRHRESIDPERPVWPWLSTITRRLCSNAQRGRRFQEVALDAVPLASAATATEEIVAARERQQSVAAAIARLSPRQRRLLVMREVEGLDYDEIAAFDASTVNALRCAVARARDAFRDAYSSLERGLATIYTLPVVRRLRFTFRPRAADPNTAQGPMQAAAVVLANLAVVGGLATGAPGRADERPARPIAAVHEQVEQITDKASASTPVSLVPAAGAIDANVKADLPGASAEVGVHVAVPSDPTDGGWTKKLRWFVPGVPPIAEPVTGRQGLGVSVSWTPEANQDPGTKAVVTGAETYCGTVDSTACYDEVDRPDR